MDKYFCWLLTIATSFVTKSVQINKIKLILCVSFIKLSSRITLDFFSPENVHSLQKYVSKKIVGLFFSSRQQAFLESRKLSDKKRYCVITVENKLAGSISFKDPRLWWIIKETKWQIVYHLERDHERLVGMRYTYSNRIIASAKQETHFVRYLLRKYQSLQRAFKKFVLSNLVFAFVNVWHSFVGCFFKNQFFQSELTRACGGFYFKLVIRFTLK
jgi:hypothetical protein